MSGTAAQSYVNVTISPDPGFTVQLDALNATEELGRPFLFEVDLSSGTQKADLTSMLGASVTVSITVPNSGDKRYFNGIVARAAFNGMVGGGYHYRLELRPWIWLLSQKHDCCIYQNQAVWDIITTTFRNAGFSNFQDKRQNQAGSQVLEYCVQYDESSLAFVSRLMEKYGIYYYSTHQDGQHTLVLADDPNSHTALTNSIPYRFSQIDYRAMDDYVRNWASDLTLQPGVYTHNDYNFTTPTANLVSKTQQAASHQYANFEVYEYPGPYGTTGDGQKLTDVRMQDLTARRQILHGSSNSRLLYTGCKFTLSDSTEQAQNQEYLVISARYKVEMAEVRSDTAGGMIDTFECEFSAIPGSIPFRLQPITGWPVMRGPQTAKVVGESGQEITTDQYGRIKVKFPWDRSSTQDENASCWIRVAQSWAGASWGGMIIPRIGQEVVVDFLDGNPDRPLVTGCVYNANQTVPYALPDNKTRSTIKTSSSTGGSGFNELRFEDKAGSEEVFFQAQKDFNLLVVKGDSTTTVQEGNHSHTVSKGNNSATVSQGNNSTTVSQGNDSLTVSQGSHSIDVSAGSSTYSAGQSITIKANQSITLQVGSNTITISTTGVSINGAEISASANASMSLNGGGSMTLNAGAIAIN